jgi:hypothetical protein
MHKLSSFGNVQKLEREREREKASKTRSSVRRHIRLPPTRHHQFPESSVIANADNLAKVTLIHRINYANVGIVMCGGGDGGRVSEISDMLRIKQIRT